MFSPGNGSSSRPISLCGIGLRREHHLYIKENKPTVNWFEVLIDNYLDVGALPYLFLESIAQHYPLAFHSVGMSLGSTDPINADYLKKIKKLVDYFNPEILSDHLSWSSVGSHYVHDLYPLPYCEEAIRVVSDNIKQVQDFFGRQLLVENVSSYLNFSVSTMSEWEFINSVAQEADCSILLDINNIYVSCKNHEWDAKKYLKGIDAIRVKQYHLGGHTDMGTFLLDTHGAAISDPVLGLFEEAISCIGVRPTLIERDSNIPHFSVLASEAEAVQKLLQGAEQCFESCS